MTVSVIVAVYNRPASLRLCVSSLAQQERRPEEIVIADDGSGPETAEVVRQLQRELPFPVWHAWQEDLGFRAAAARNNGVRQSRGEYLIFVDCDLILPPGFISCHLDYARPGTILLGSVLRLGLEDSAALTAEELGIGDLGQLPLLAERSRLRRTHRKNQRHAFLRRLHGCKPHKPKLAAGNFSLYRSDFERVNGFDEDFVGWGQEDDDLGRRLMSAGVRPRSVVPYAIAYHLHHPTQGGAWREGPNAWRLARKQVDAWCANGMVKSRTTPLREEVEGSGL